MRIFEVDASLKSYTYPTAKIAIALSIIIICIMRNHIIRVNGEPMRTILAVICGILVVLCILRVYISVAEIIHVYENQTVDRKKMAGDESFTAKEYTIDRIIALAEKNDIIEIEVSHKGSTAKIGTSSDCKNSDNQFFDKLYFIDNINYATIEDFESKLVSLSEDGSVLSVISIDGIRAKG